MRSVRRPLHIESLGGSALLGLHQLGLYDARVDVSFGGSQDLAGTLAAAVAAVQGAVVAAAVLLVWRLFARGVRSRERALTATAASVVALVAFGKVLSPQFLIWVVFVVPLVERRLFARAFGLVVAALVLTRAYSRTGTRTGSCWKVTSSGSPCSGTSSSLHSWPTSSRRGPAQIVASS